MKYAVITGASGNLGKVVCRNFSSQGYYVIAIVGQNETPDINDFDSNTEFHRVDLTSEIEVYQICEDICGLYPRIDVAVFLAGGFAMGDLLSTGKSEIDHMFRLNFETAYFFSRKIFGKMEIQGGGDLFFVGARPAVNSSSAVGMVGYSLSKSLVVKLSEIYNEAGKKKNIRSTVIIPSTIDTPANRKATPNADFSKWVDPQKIAQTILFICSENGSELREGVLKLYGNS